MALCKTGISPGCLTLSEGEVKGLFCFQSFSEDVFQSVRSLLQSDKELCSVSAEDRAKQDGPVGVTEV